MKYYMKLEATSNSEVGKFLNKYFFWDFNWLSRGATNEEFKCWLAEEREGDVMQTRGNKLFNLNSENLDMKNFEIRYDILI